ncbi:hypothetical protein MAA_07328 [Metarhizium robertsii ARSEF 23]|uniref:Copper homeostasis protein cutC homolog n=1 Tax=Metarhizium robertsii (strain ARSEF 23 / ATCC MYA-3075) TaxID=655844 RepID=E9F4X9_METRA|nr:uncharacterized protein MAA_07328 [Metarhizium robertsii ARSEF 23]EFY97311.1 hypothetical protein MAA_07328 [Metarhizium robertsii ARSEF 23]
MPLEVAVFSGESALKAQSQGASRVELNAPGSYHVGGTTPPIAELKRIAAKVTIPVRIMIRPRGAPGDGSPDFVYTPKEVAAMAQSIRDFKATGLLNPFRGDGFAGRIQFVLGGGLRASNVERVAGRFSTYEKGSVWMHTAALSSRPDHPAEEIDSNELVGMLASLGSVPVR